MRRTLFVLIFQLLPLLSMAQGDAGWWYIKPMIGVNLAKVTGDRLQFGTPPDNETRTPRLKAGFSIGANVEYQLLEPLGLSLGLHFSQQGYGYDDYPGHTNPNVKLYYLHMPVMANLYLAQGFAFKLGVQPAMAVRKRFIYEDATGEVARDARRFKTFDWGIPIGLSYTLEFMEFEVLYTFGRYDIVGSDHSNPVHNRNISVNVGYRFEL